jgi:sugar transferase EpsL
VIRRRDALKRTFDVVGASFALLVVWPVMAAIAIAVWWTMGSPVIFRQVRPGRYGQPFELLKFRTMTEARGPDGALLPDADRITRLGRFLRRTSLDELPELVNVLRSDMSIVGPRPLLMEYLSLYTPEQMRRHEVRPGITGWAVVNGRNALDWEERFRLDVWYVEHRSLWLDLRILVETVGLVLSGHGVNAPGHASMGRFTGAADAASRVLPAHQEEPR